MTFLSSLSVVLIAGTAHATTVCKPREEMLAELSGRYEAERRASGIIRPFDIMEVWVSRVSKDWMILSTDLDGSSCIIAFGENFSRSKPGQTAGKEIGRMQGDPSSEAVR